MLFPTLEIVLPCFLHSLFCPFLCTRTAFLTPHFLDTFTATSASSFRDLREKDAVLQNQSGCGPWINPLLPTQTKKTWIKCSMRSLVSFSSYLYKSDKYIFRNHRIKHCKHRRARKQPGWKKKTYKLLGVLHPITLFFITPLLLPVTSDLSRTKVRNISSATRRCILVGRQRTKYLRKFILMCQLSSLLT